MNNFLAEGLTVTPNVQKALSFTGNLLIAVAEQAGPEDDSPGKLTLQDLLEVVGSQLGKL